jgi:mannose/fructose-specific phosphotransferase system component IIA
MSLINTHNELANPASSSVVAGLPSPLIVRVYEKNNSRNKTQYVSRSIAQFVPQVCQKNVRQFS